MRAINGILMGVYAVVMEESMCHEMVIHLSQRFSIIYYGFFLHVFISFKV